MRAAFVRITLAVALCLGAAGCGDDSPSPKPYTGPSKSATPTGAPTLPAEADGTSLASAKAFVTHYLAVFSYASTTGDTKAMKSLASSDCRTCRRLSGSVDSTYAAGGKAVGRGFAVKSLDLVSKAEDRPLVLEGVVTIYPQKFMASRGADPTESAGGPAKSRFKLTQGHHGWLIADWELL